MPDPDGDAGRSSKSGRAGSDADAGGPPAPRGRPRDTQVDASIAEATIALLLDNGLEGLTIDAVARRSGVSRPAIYRRYADKHALIEHCVWQLGQAQIIDAPVSDDPVADVLDMLESTIKALTQTPFGGLFRVFVPHLHPSSRYAKLANAIGARRRLALRPALLRAQSHGCIDAEADLELLADAVLGAIYFRFLLGRSINRAYARRLLLAMI